MLEVVLSSLSTISVYCLVLFLSLWFWFQWTFWRLLRMASKLPTLCQCIPLLGHAHHTMYSMEHMTALLLRITTEAVAKGMTMACFWCGPYPLIFVAGSENIQKVLKSSNSLEKAFEYKFMKHAFGDGLLTAPMRIWRVTNRHLSPMFHPRNLEQMFPTFNRNSRKLVSRLGEHVGTGPVNMSEHTMDLTLETITQMIFGTDTEIDIESQEFKNMKVVVERVFELALKRIVQAWLRVDPIFNWVYKKELHEIREHSSQFMEQFLHTSQSKSKEKNKKESVEDTFNDNQPSTKEILNLVDVFSVLQENYPQFTENELKSEIVTLCATGSDTVALSIAYCLLLLAHHEDIQEKLYTEVTSSVGFDDVTLQDLEQMTYLDQVFKETLRWAAIVPVIARRTTGDITLDSHTIPAGSTICVTLHGLNMDPKTFPNPQNFDPERFSLRNAVGIERSAFLPFSGGPRSCIGKRYAELLMKTAVVHVVRQYSLKTTMDIHNLKRRLAITMPSVDGHMISIESRN